MCTAWPPEPGDTQQSLRSAQGRDECVSWEVRKAPTAADTQRRGLRQKKHSLSKIMEFGEYNWDVRCGQEERVAGGQARWG